MGLTRWALVSSVTPEQPPSKSQREAPEKRSDSPPEAGKLGFGVRPTCASVPAPLPVSCATLAQAPEQSGPSVPRVYSGGGDGGGAVADEEGAEQAAGRDHHASLPLLHGAPYHPPWGDGRSCRFPGIQLTYLNSSHFSFKK